MSRPETKRARIVRLANEAIKRDDAEGLVDVLEELLYQLSGARLIETLKITEVFTTLAEHGPPDVVDALDGAAVRLLEETYAELDAEDARRAAGKAAAAETAPAIAVESGVARDSFGNVALPAKEWEEHAERLERSIALARQLAAEARAREKGAS